MTKRNRWLLTALAGLALVGLAISAGHERRDDEAAADDEPTSGEVSFPMPEPERIKLGLDQARGLYTLKQGDMQFTLDLQAGSRFRFVSARAGKPLREATGTWNLVGTRLTLAYQHVPGQPQITKANPEVVVNAWYGRSIELKNTGSATPIVLKKRTAMRQK